MKFFIESMLDEILQIKNLAGLSNTDAFDLIGRMIDLSDIYNRDEGINRALKLCNELAARSLEDKETSLIHYFFGNIWSILRRQILSKQPKLVWSWEQTEIVKALFHLRTAIRHKGFEQLDKFRRCQILTNTANVFNTLGRSTEAIEYWNRALEIIPNFGMALGNRGSGLMHYAPTLYDKGHIAIILKHAHADLRHATSSHAFFECPDYDDIKEGMAREADKIAAYFDLEKLTAVVDLEHHSLGRSKKEKNYRRWCLHHRLFLSPLNDLGPYPIAAHDVMTLPDIVLGAKEPPSLIGFYNQLKQEYIAARYLYYEGKENSKRHYADNGVLLYNTLDYPEYSVSVEQIKAAFRMAYSLFDKIAYFTNTYWRLGIPEKLINFRSVWYEKKGKAVVIRHCFKDYENWPLRGLFWLSKDLFEKNTELAETMEPDAEALNSIRNHLEHKYLKVHSLLFSIQRQAGPISDMFCDTLAYSIIREELEAKALRLLKLARAALIYLSLGVHQEEKHRLQQRGDKMVMPMMLSAWKDDWKR